MDMISTTETGVSGNLGGTWIRRFLLFISVDLSRCIASGPPSLDLLGGVLILQGMY